MTSQAITCQVSLALQWQPTSRLGIWNCLCFSRCSRIFNLPGVFEALRRASFLCMTSHFAWQGFVVGCLAAVPLGPMGMVCVRRTLVSGRLSGLVSACGLTLAAAFWCVVAAQGLSQVADLVAGREKVFTAGLGVFLCAAGILGLARGHRQAGPLAPNALGSLASQFVSSLLGVVFNPVTFVTMTAVLAILGGVGGQLSVQRMLGLAGAVFLGGMTVWVCLTQGVVTMRNRLGERGGAWISNALNCCILAVGIVYMVRPFVPHAMG